MTRLGDVMTERVIEDPVLRQRYSFTTSTDDDGSEVLHVDTWVDPGGGVTPHVHPAIEERFKVLAGTPSFLAGRVWTAASPGQTIVVPPGTRHAYRNAWRLSQKPVNEPVLQSVVGQHSLLRRMGWHSWDGATVGA